MNKFGLDAQVSITLSRTIGLIQLVSVSLLLSVFSTTTQAWCIHNKTDAAFNVSAYGDDILGATVKFTKKISAAGKWCCNHDLTTGDGRCYREGTGFHDTSVRATIDPATGKRFACNLTMDRAGTSEILSESRNAPPLDLGIGPNYYCKSKNQSGKAQDSSNAFGVGATSRNVRFLASGDPQMDNGTTLSQGKAAKTQQLMWIESQAVAEIRGILVAGDLTMTNYLDEIDWYRFGTFELIDGKWVGGIIGGEQPHFYEGLGNHDVNLPATPLAAAACLAGLWWCQNPKFLRNFVRNKHRSTVTTARGPKITRPIKTEDKWIPNVNSDSCDILTGRCDIWTPHYSWDWHDVHFVMLNNIAAQGADGVRNNTGGSPDHLESLTFLKTDLKNNVGTSKRPVIVVQHYDLRGTNFNDGELHAFWDAIAGYNVIAIIHGHDSHLGRKAPMTGHSSRLWQWRNIWYRPDGKQGPKHIDVFNASASHNETFIDVKIDDEKMTLKRMDTSLVAHSQECKLLCPSTAPKLFGTPGDVTVECDSLPAVPDITSFSAQSACGSNPGLSDPTAYDIHDVVIKYEGERRIDGLCEDEYQLERIWSATDSCGNTTTTTQLVTVEDTMPPVVYTDPNNQACLWPANHKYSTFGGIREMVEIVDNCDPAPGVNDVSCFSNQCDDAPCDAYPGQSGDGNTVNDCAYDWENDVLSTRAERAMNTDGRNYSTSFTGIDRCDNESDSVVGFSIDVPANKKDAKDCD